MRSRPLAILLATTASIALGAPALAADASSAAASQSGAVPELVVTAQKREEALKNVPMAVAAVTAQRVDMIQAKSLADYINMVPGVSFTETAQGAGTVTIRGINAGGVASTVGIYVDQIPYGSSSALADGAFLAADIDPFDMSRVEVLKGPQGTLYGAGALGGVINYVTEAPSTASAGGRLEAGIDGVSHGGTGWDIKGAINAPINDKLALRLTGYDQDIPGFISDPINGVNELNRSNVYGGRISLLYTPTSNFSVRLTMIGQSIADRAGPVEDLAVPTSATDLRPLFGRYQYSDAIPPDLNRDQVRYWLYNGTIDWNLGWADLVSSTSYGVLDSLQRFDFTALAGLGDFLNDTATTDKFTQEVRLTSPSGHRLEWQAGVYYTHEDSDLLQILGSTPTGGRIDLSQSLPSTFEEVAGYGDVDYHFTPQVDLTVGGRVAGNKQFGGQVGESFGFPINLGQHSSNTDFTYSVSPRWKPTDDIMVYGRVATGYQPGGPNVIDIIHSPTGTPTSFGPESLINYEIGAKTQFFDRKLSLELAAFYIDWSNIQLLGTVNGVSLTTNGGKAVSGGFEFTAQARPLPGLDIVWSGAYDDAHLTEDTPPQVGGLKGDPLPFAPKFATTLSGDYDWPIMNDLNGFVGGDFRYMGSQGAGFGSGGVPGVRQFIMPSYTTLDLRAGVRWKRTTFELFAKNVADTHAYTSVGEGFSQDGGAGNPLGENFQATVLTPRTVGVSARTRF